ncbi:MAG TPA: hypothetical protein VHO47_05335 [Candidatus Babeliales bacterium]|nr:hypothetical protein [Candidatus Babeliales bacterium]
MKFIISFNKKTLAAALIAFSINNGILAEEPKKWKSTIEMCKDNPFSVAIGTASFISFFYNYFKLFPTIDAKVKYNDAHNTLMNSSRALDSEMPNFPTSANNTKSVRSLINQVSALGKTRVAYESLRNKRFGLKTMGSVGTGMLCLRNLWNYRASQVTRNESKKLD